MPPHAGAAIDAPADQYRGATQGRRGVQSFPVSAACQTRARVTGVEIVFERPPRGACSHVRALQWPRGIVRWLRKIEKLKSAALPTVV
jgi:hypothetical protein